MEFGTKNLEKTWNLGPKTLRNPGIWYLEKSGNPVYTIAIRQQWLPPGAANYMVFNFNRW